MTEGQKEYIGYIKDRGIGKTSEGVYVEKIGGQGGNTTGSEAENNEGTPGVYMHTVATDL